MFYSQQRIIVTNSYNCKGKIQNSFLLIRHTLDFNKENWKHFKELGVISSSFFLSLLTSAMTRNWNAYRLTGKGRKEIKKNDYRVWLKGRSFQWWMVAWKIIHWFPSNMIFITFFIPQKSRRDTVIKRSSAGLH